MVTSPKLGCGLNRIVECLEERPKLSNLQVGYSIQQLQLRELSSRQALQILFRKLVQQADRYIPEKFSAVRLTQIECPDAGAFDV